MSLRPRSEIGDEPAHPGEGFLGEPLKELELGPDVGGPALKLDDRRGVAQVLDDAPLGKARQRPSASSTRGDLSPPLRRQSLRPGATAAPPRAGLPST